MPASEPILTATGISKRFGITQALDDVSVSFRAGEVHALMGENGAGKSTLGKVIAGLHAQNSGSVVINGRELIPGSLDDAFHAGIRIVHQELAQCPNLSVAENLCLHDLPTKGMTVDFAEMERRASMLVHQLDPDIDVTKPLGYLSPGRRQICQIAASLDKNPDGSMIAKVIVLDEPTSSLSISEASILMDITRDLASQGLTMIYVSHRMSEIFTCCDRVTILRDGKFVATNIVADIDEPTLVEQMIGRRIETPAAKSDGMTAESVETMALKSEIRGDAPDQPVVDSEPCMKIRDLSSPGKLDNCSLDLHPGEVLGIGGLVGAGRSELFDAIFNIDTRATGSVNVDGREILGKGIRAAIEAGVGLGYVPEDRRIQGLFFNLGIDENILAPIMNRISGFCGIRKQADELEAVRNRINRFQIKTASLSETTPGELSGGNQQKLLIARWMTEQTKVLLLDEPTRGIDVGTKSEIYKLIRQAADEGLAILLVSSEMPELLALSDRILVMGDGQIKGELTGVDMTQTNILTLATKEKHQEKAHVQLN
ncbi:MAG: sugar ABC transporter ATP-binding protein [Phycisphaerales bacterium]|nr:sugar ABC transporter ATP-binding protein [Phycisphaerales bacterium]